MASFGEELRRLGADEVALDADDRRVAGVIGVNTLTSLITGSVPAPGSI